jgi:hypothetical protein
LGKLYVEQGVRETAVYLRQEARITIEIIIEQIPEGKLPASFVAQLPVGLL